MSQFTIYKTSVSPKGNTTVVLMANSTVTFGNLRLQSVVMDNAFCWHTFRGNLEQSFTQLQSQNAVIEVDSPLISVADADGKGGGKLLLTPNSHLKVFVNGEEQTIAVASAPAS
jgi:hypothetical protein